jgi:enamine deaminase RidA (YjgF/YER057c/UK114 family)
MKTTSLLSLIMLSALQAGDIQCIEPSGGSSRCVVVNAAPLAPTAQVMGEGATLTDQVKSMLAGVDGALKSGGSSLAQAMKLNVYVTLDSATREVETALALAFSGAHRPAVSFVTTVPPSPSALIAMDAIGVAADAR